ncbi:MlaD family protein [Mycobacterium paragordonae]|uniref:MlaD family protein n=1 Tax=Mycobacterium paragordonae TaxID=1389713 RepID=A0A4R5WJL0_9MYCO|nr:MlaD family protein [Mycobacterium paragordonae]MDP7738421.1 MlaD family protein [Mycobacterium paragordonae]TDK90928.1 MCE family protein [Mycobacterium paragordonae]TDL03683.1 MCE family protein [Mycobacterium paragordonae]
MTIRDLVARRATATTLRIRGLAVAVVLALIGTVLYQTAQGTYDDTFKLTVIANTIGEGLAPGAEVKFHGLAIGSVKELESVGYNRQRMTVLLDPRQAGALTTDTKARFTSSNVFGTAAVELVSDGNGPPLRSNQTLVMSADVQAASITGLLRQGQKLSRSFDNPEFEHVIEVLRRHADIVEPLARAGSDLAKIIADTNTMPVAQSLSVLASFVTGLGDALPVVGLSTNLVDGLTPLVGPGGIERTNLVFQQTGQLLVDVGQLAGQNSTWIVQMVNAIMNVGVPASFAAGSLAPAYDRLSSLVDRADGALTVVDGQVRLRTEVSLDGSPRP